MTNSAALKQARMTGRRLILLIIGFYGAAAILTAWAVGTNVGVTAACAAGILLISLNARRMFGRLADYALVLGTVGQTALITAAFAGHPWQVDSHMIYYVTLAQCILLINPWALICAAGFIALHHGILSIALPALVYPTADVLSAIERTVFHAALVIMETVILVWAVQQRLKMVATNQATNASLSLAQEKTEQALISADEARAAAIAAQENAETEAKRAREALEDLQMQAEKARLADAETQSEKLRHTETQNAATAALEHVVGDLSDALSGLAAKNLAWRLETPFPEAYESVRTDYNKAIHALSDTVANITTQISRIQSNAGAIANTSKEQSQRSTDRSTSLSEVTGALKELAGSVDLVAQNAAQASETVSVSRQHADEGVHILGQAHRAMEQIDESANEISKIVSLIEDIAFQTNLLSLNAGVEAARAGEAGRGFAVVATEVRALAQRSSDSANEIKSLISKSSQQVKTGYALVKDSGAALTQILDGVSMTNGQVDEINISVNEQNKRLSNIAKSLEQLSQSSDQDATMIEATAVASTTLDEATADLALTISVFTTERTEETNKPDAQDTRRIA